MSQNEIIQKRIDFFTKSRLSYISLFSKTGPVFLKSRMFYSFLPAFLDKFTTITYDSLLRMRGLKPVSLLGLPYFDIVEAQNPLKQHNSYLNYWHDPGRHAMVCMQLGLDFTEHNGKYYLLDCNLDSALRPDRGELYDSEYDPIVTETIEFARQHNFHKIVVILNHWQRNNMQGFEQAGERRNIKIELKVPRYSYDPHVPKFIPSPLEKDTLYLIFITRRTPVDYFIGNKRCMGYWYNDILQENSGAYPMLSYVDTSAELTDDIITENPTGPNLVVKYAVFDEGKYLLMLKVNDADEARKLLKTPDGKNPAPLKKRLKGLQYLEAQFFSGSDVIYQKFIPPKLNPQGYPEVYRLHMIVSPLGHKFLSAHRITSIAKPPDNLSNGIVEDLRPYIINHSQGAQYGLAYDKYDDFTNVIQEVGAVMNTALHNKFICQP